MVNSLVSLMHLSSKNSVRASFILRDIYLGAYYRLEKIPEHAPFMKDENSYSKAMKFLVDSFSKCQDEYAFKNLLKIFIYRIYKVEEKKKYLIQIQSPEVNINIKFDYLTNCYQDYEWKKNLSKKEEFNKKVKILQGWASKIVDRAKKEKSLMLKPPKEFPVE